MPLNFISPVTGRFMLTGWWLMVYDIFLFTYLWLYQAYPANIGTKAIEQAAMLKDLRFRKPVAEPVQILTPD
jgi:hypothetical protein